MKKNNKKIPRHIKNNSNFSFWYSMLVETENVVNLKKIKNVTDFGCGDGGFLQLFNHYYKKTKLIGVEKQDRLVDQCGKENKCKNIRFIHSDEFSKIETESQDLIFSQEVVYTIEDLDLHAQEIFDKLKKGGYYIFTSGCHTDNPTWRKRKIRILNEEPYHAYDYSPTEIAKPFYDAGFRISLKRLPIYFPLVFDFSSTNEFSSIHDLLISSEENKLLFILLKPKYIK